MSHREPKSEAESELEGLKMSLRVTLGPWAQPGVPEAAKAVRAEKH